MRIVVIGNSGSGKTWLANQFADLISADVIHLDDIFWEPGGFDKKREPKAIETLVEVSKAKEAWIAEGVFGELAQLYFEEASTLIWLNLDWGVCQERLCIRGSKAKSI